MFFLRPNSKNCILGRRPESPASSTLLRTSREYTVIPVPYHLSTVHLVLTAKWPASGVLASKPHVQERHLRRVSCARTGPIRPRSAGIRSHAHPGSPP